MEFLRLNTAWLIALSCLAAACSPSLGKDGVIRAEVSAEAGLSAPWFCLEARGERGEPVVTGPLALEREATLAIYPAEGMRERVSLVARGHAEEDCDAAIVGASASVEARFEKGEVTAVTLVIAPPTVCSDDCSDPACAGAPCDDGNACTASDTCVSGVCQGQSFSCAIRGECFSGVCDPSSGCEVLTGETCGGKEGTVCLADGSCQRWELECGNGVDDDLDGAVDCADSDCAEQLCRPADGLCDVAESCTAGACPADALAPADAACRSSGGDCDPSEVCDGASKDCPGDERAMAGTSCRAAAGLCDTGEVCDGTSATCPEDGFVGAGTECRPEAGLCDQSEVCTGDAPQCPDDTFRGGTFECRGPAGDCDVAEFCSGASAACPEDALMASGTVCRGASDSCDVAETCSGQSAVCGPNAFASEGTVCTDGVCDGAGGCRTFGYTPANFDPAAHETLAAQNGAWVVDCDVTFNSSPAATQDVWCGGRPAPMGVTVVQAGGPDVVVIPLTGFTVGAQGRVHLSGTRPVLFAVYGDASIVGELRASASGQVGGVGTASSAALCAQGAGQPGGDAVASLLQDVGGGGGGGGGAGFGGPGATGGMGSNRNADVRGAAGTAGGLEGDALNTPLRAGCAGGRGGAGDPPSGESGAGGAGGGGGGAIQVSVSGTLSVSGIVAANGGGGRGAMSFNGGGGGGGSGGAILLEANALTVLSGAKIGATGGGGGEGANEAGTSTPDQFGQDGADGAFPLGGEGGDSAANQHGGSGGDGAGVSATAGGNGASAFYAGGGGGGAGVGRVRLTGKASCAVAADTLAGEVSRGMNCN